MQEARNTVTQLRTALAEAARQLYRRGFVSGTRGNLSAKISGEDIALIKPTGFCLGTIKPEDFVEVALTGRILGSGKPSKELMLHLSVYKARPDVQAIIHTHQPYGTALASSKDAVQIVERLFEAAALVNYAPPGSLKLARLTACALSETATNIALLKGHGVIVVGRDVRDALTRACKLEEVSKRALQVATS